MKKVIFLSVLYFLCSAFSGVMAQNNDSIAIRHIFSDALTDSTSYHNLRNLTSHYSKRLAGSEQSQKSVAWAFQLLKSMGLDSVWMQECKVRHWDRGNKEIGRVISTKAGDHDLSVCALGGSIATA